MFLTESTRGRHAFHTHRADDGVGNKGRIRGDKEMLEMRENGRLYGFVALFSSFSIVGWSLAHSLAQLLAAKP